MIRRIYCPRCKMIVDTIVEHGRETCPRCNECITCGEGFVASEDTKSG